MNGEKDILKAQVVDRSSSSTSVNHQLEIIKDEVVGLKSSLVPKMNALSENYKVVSDTLADLELSQRGIEAISSKVDKLQHETYSQNLYVEGRLATIDKNMLTLHTGMGHLYDMIKESFPPTSAQKEFFEDLLNKDAEKILVGSILKLFKFNL